MQWGSGRIIDNLPSVIAAGMDRSFLPQLFKQLPPRGTGLRLGTARSGLERGIGRRLTEMERLKRHREIYGSELSLHTEEEVLNKNIQYNHQLTNYPIIPLLDRPHPVLDKIKAQAPIVPRTKLLGVFGIIDPTEWPPKAATEKNVPEPWGPREWTPGAEVGRLPSVIQTGGGVPGPSRTMHPKEISIVM
jgi:hypothetical protein